MQVAHYLTLDVGRTQFWDYSLRNSPRMSSKNIKAGLRDVRELKLNIEMVRLFGCPRLTREEAHDLLEFIENHTTLRTIVAHTTAFSWISNEFVANAVRRNRRITEIYIVDTFFNDDGVATLTQTVGPAVHTLHLILPDITQRGVDLLTQFLRTKFSGSLFLKIDSIQKRPPPPNLVRFNLTNRVQRVVVPFTVVFLAAKPPSTLARFMRRDGDHAIWSGLVAFFDFNRKF